MIATHNAIDIAADRDTIFRLAAAVTEWPAILPHYRYVRVLERCPTGPTERYVEMAARRTGIPVSWSSLQRVDARRGEVFYHHIEGATRGMDVLWRIEPRGEYCHVTIDHDLPRPRRWLRSAPARFIVGRLFVEHIADRTLRGIKKAAEAQVQGGSA